LAEPRRSAQDNRLPSRKALRLSRQTVPDPKPTSQHFNATAEKKSGAWLRSRSQATDRCAARTAHL